MRNFNKTIRLVFLLICIMSCVVVEASWCLLHPAPWDEVDLSNINWTQNSNVRYQNRSIEYLSFWNWHALTKENIKQRTWRQECVYLYPIMDESRNWECGFTIGNYHDLTGRLKYMTYNEKGKRRWHKGSIYYGVKVTIITNKGQKETYEKYFCNGSDGLRYTYDSDQNIWSHDHTVRFDKARKLTEFCISREGEYIRVTVGRDFGYTFSDAKQLYSIAIVAGPAAKVYVNNFHALRESDVAIAKPYIKNGDESFNNNDFLSAIKNYTYVIDMGLGNHDVYLKRAKAFYQIKFYRNAIDDCTNALSYVKSDDAYFLRGSCKIIVEEDIQGGLDDLSKGGVQGQAMLKELISIISTKP